MFRRLMQAMTRSAVEPALIQQTLQTTLGQDYANAAENLYSNRLRDDRAKRRAIGVVTLGRAIVSTRAQLNDPDRHAFLWQQVAKPGIDARFQASHAAYDPARFYVDAVDYAAAMNLLPTLLQGGEQPLATMMVEVVQNLNARLLPHGGYFGNTPYWTLHDHQVWRGIDRAFTSVQAYWLVLLVVDQVAAEVQRVWAQALLGADLPAMRVFTPDQRAQLFGTDLPALAYTVSLGAVAQAAITAPASPRALALMQTLSSMGGDALAALNTVINVNTAQAVRAFKSVFSDTHPLQGLPDSDVVLALQLQVAAAKVFTAVPLIQTLISLPRDQDVLSDARETVPHLLNASG
ncbi:hypothetical protein MF271_16665 [Deinococcus sp. KNUC1210]|uniref:hypothetical protein n=1 Tax=Deinococcus sp. KNUC1210 TaxID=2917691 RepID=UPI001EEFA9F5|nr:hypothetical protein [Deinococcus sp. KNUC1210]ULH15521.1 hypothetical protein MF271_16665 [Deinococcus sp. KNUC1210]